MKSFLPCHREGGVLIQQPFGTFDRIPPQNLEAEQAVLGSMLIERSALEKAAEILKPDDFYRDVHRHIFEAMLALAERDEPVDLITLPDELKSRNLFESSGGLLYLQILMDAPSTAANIEYYADLGSSTQVYLIPPEVVRPPNQQGKLPAHHRILSPWTVTVKEIAQNPHTLCSALCCVPTNVHTRIRFCCLSGLDGSGRWACGGGHFASTP